MKLFELPKGWVRTKVRNVCDLINGRAFKPSEWSSNGLPIIRIQNLNNINADFNYCDFEVGDKYFVNNKQLLFAWSGTPGTSFGAHIWNRGKAVLNQHIFKVEINEKHLNKSFFMHLINNNIDEYIRKAHGTAGLAHITKNKFENSIVAIPPLPEQHRIVTKVEELFTQLDAGAGALTKAKVQLKRYRQSVLKSACDGRLVPTEAELARAEGRDYEPADVLLARIGKERREKWEAEKKRKCRKSAKYKEPAAPDAGGLPGLPEGWCYTLLDPLLSTNRAGMKTGPFGSLLKKHEHMPDGVPVVGIENIAAMKFITGSKIHITKEKSNQLSGYDALPGDVLISRSGTVGEVCVVPDSIGEARISTNVMRVTLALHGMFPHFFCFLFNGAPFVLGQVSELCKGSTRDFLNQKILSSIIFPLPPLIEQNRIIAEIERRLSVADKTEKTIDQSRKQAERLRQSILEKAFEGKLVPQDLNDEPASVLLEQIKKEKSK